MRQSENQAAMEPTQSRSSQVRSFARQKTQKLGISSAIKKKAKLLYQTSRSHSTSRSSSASGVLGGAFRTRSYTKEAFIKAEHIAAVIKINTGQFDDIQMEEIQELFTVLDVDHSGSLDFKEIAEFLKQVLDPALSENEVEAIYQLTDRHPDGKVTPEEFHKAMTTGPVKHHLKQTHDEAKIMREFHESQGDNAVVTRDLLLEWMHWRVTRDDAFRTMPFSVAFILVFISLVSVHLNVWSRQQVERGVSQWVEGYGADLVGPFFTKHVADPSTLKDWMVSSGLGAVLGDCRGSGDSILCHLNKGNVLVGDVQLKKIGFDHEFEVSEWLLHSSQAKAWINSSSPSDMTRFKQGAVQRLNHLWENNWVDESVEQVNVIFITYSERARMFTKSVIKVVFDRWGFMVPTLLIHATPVDPYPDGSKVGLILLDLLYLFFILYPLYNEVKELLIGVRIMGCYDGIMDYLGPWNVIDLCSMSMGMVNCIFWLSTLAAINADSINSIIDEDGKRLRAGTMDLDVARIEEVEASLQLVIDEYFALHIVMALNVVTIMAKFFKAFSANPRLEVVTSTLVNAASDMCHFLIVFMAIFIGVAVVGHILFGIDLVQFNSFGMSFNTAFTVLMGDFPWYVEESKSEHPLASGMPKWMLDAWFYTFMIFVLLVLLNMLLAIILEHYSKLTAQLAKRTDAPAIWTQTMRFVRRARATQGFRPLASMLSEIVNDAKVHKEHMVTKETLIKAFNLKDEQADYLMQELQVEATKRAKEEAGADDEQTARLKGIEAMVQVMAKQLKSVSLSVSTCVTKLDDLEGERLRTSKLSPMDLSTGLSNGFADGKLADESSSLQEQILQSVQSHKGAMQEVSALVSELRVTAARLDAPFQQSPMAVPASARSPSLQGSRHQPPQVAGGYCCTTRIADCHRTVGA